MLFFFYVKLLAHENYKYLGYKKFVWESIILLFKLLFFLLSSSVIYKWAGATNTLIGCMNG